MRELITKLVEQAFWIGVAARENTEAHPGTGAVWGAGTDVVTVVDTVFKNGSLDDVKGMFGDYIVEEDVVELFKTVEAVRDEMRHTSSVVSDLMGKSLSQPSLLDVPSSYCEHCPDTGGSCGVCLAGEDNSIVSEVIGDLNEFANKLEAISPK